jgi:serine/threonine protein kinase
VERWRDALRPYVIQSDIWGSYKFQGVLGKGAYGKVFYAIDRATATEVAVKILDKKVIATRVSGIEGLVREIKVHW